MLMTENLNVVSTFFIKSLSVTADYKANFEFWLSDEHINMRAHIKLAV